MLNTLYTDAVYLEDLDGAARDVAGRAAMLGLGLSLVEDRPLAIIAEARAGVGGACREIARDIARGLRSYPDTDDLTALLRCVAVALATATADAGLVTVPQHEYRFWGPVVFGGELVVGGKGGGK